MSTIYDIDVCLLGSTIKFWIRVDFIVTYICKYINCVDSLLLRKDVPKKKKSIKSNGGKKVIFSLGKLIAMVLLDVAVNTYRFHISVLVM